MTVSGLTSSANTLVPATPLGWDEDATGMRAIHKMQGRTEIGYVQLINPDRQVKIHPGRWHALVTPPSSVRSDGWQMTVSANALNRQNFYRPREADLAGLKQLPVTQKRRR